jgi:uncharacterized protein (TIGR02453 family)
MNASPLDLDLYPPFDGFPKEGLDFLRRLKKNNNREWFASHKTEYEELVKLPMQSLVASLRGPITKIAPEIDVNPKKSIFRIYRDTRFSRNKEPYKTNVAAVFHPHGHWQKSAGLYLHIEPGEIFLGGGIYMPASDELKKLRAGIAARGDELLEIVRTRSFKRLFGEVEGEKLQRVPVGYPADHPMGPWLKYKSLYTSASLPESDCYRPGFVRQVVSMYKEMVSFIRFLNSTLYKK